MGRGCLEPGSPTRNAGSVPAAAAGRSPCIIWEFSRRPPRCAKHGKLTTHEGTNSSGAERLCYCMNDYPAILDAATCSRARQKAQADDPVAFNRLSSGSIGRDCWRWHVSERGTLTWLKISFRRRWSGVRIGLAHCVPGHRRVPSPKGRRLVAWDSAQATKLIGSHPQNHRQTADSAIGSVLAGRGGRRELLA
jgi:hypothetical protein